MTSQLTGSLSRISFVFASVVFSCCYEQYFCMQTIAYPEANFGEGNQSLEIFGSPFLESDIFWPPILSIFHTILLQELFLF